MNIIKHKFVFLTIAAILVVTSVAGIAVHGFERGIDFTGGTLWQVQFEGDTTTQTALSTYIREDLELSEAIIAAQGDNAFSIKVKELTEEEHREYKGALEAEFGEMTELSFQSIGASIGRELTERAIWAFIINLIAITLYVAYAFRKVSRPVSSWKYGMTTLATLFHDAIIPVGLFAYLGHYLGVEIDTNFIVAILVVVGFSVHDTIVVFDRIRENLRKGSTKPSEFGSIVNASINETIARSVNTSITLIVVLAALYFFGAATLAYFILAILVGTVMGTYSSIFVASPLLVAWGVGKKQ